MRTRRTYSPPPHWNRARNKPIRAQVPPSGEPVQVPPQPIREAWFNVWATSFGLVWRGVSYSRRELAEAQVDLCRARGFGSRCVYRLHVKLK